ncbi:MFS transporter [Paraburkholderia caribensis]|uniref:MFS transporter n=1 Tax=Paraburkholderia caribensis TaxID=75105 RepID=UPI000722D775|nr:MFS transporter [Paraburkholderia caribensis]ALP64818.1 MFS transporter [Paraburkholderia caribensis]AUT54033.1 MFS transporter [Paraburkholderia caribensis]
MSSISQDVYLQRSGTGVYAKVAWRLIPFLFFCYLCAYLDRINVSFAKLQMLQDLGMSDAVYGLGAGIFFVGYLMFEVPSNLILLKVGARRWIARIMVTWGVISAAMMFVSTPTQFYVVRFLLGVAEAGFFPAILLYLTYWFPAGRRSKVTALFMTGIPMSGVIGGPLSGWIMHSMSGAHGIAGWQWLFLLEGIPTVLVGIVAYFYLDDKVSDARWLRDDEKALIEADLQAESGHHKLHSLRDGLASPRVLLLSAIYFFFTMGLYGVSFWLPSLVKASGVSGTLNIGLLSAVPYAAAAVTMVLVGRSSDRYGERRWHLAVPGVVGAIALCASVVYAHQTVLAMIALTIGTMGVITTISQFWTVPPAVLQGTAAAGGIALANSVGSISGVVSPYVIGFLQTSTGSTGSGVVGIAVSMVFGSLLTLALRPAHVNVFSQRE